MNKTVLFFLLVLSLIPGCRRDDSDDVVPSRLIKCVYPDSLGNIHAKVGDTIEIEYTGNAYDGGFMWTITHDFNPAIAGYLNYWTVYTGDSGVMGAPMKELWRYSSIAEGVDTLIMKLHQP